VKNIATALLKVQKNLDPVHKGRKGYGYNYADLPAVMDACLEALNNEGIVVIQAPTTTDKQAAAICTRLIHAESGEEVYGVIEVPTGTVSKMSDAQAYGSAMTYGSRYALVSMLGIVTEDDDGASAGKKAEVSVDKVTASENALEWARGFVALRAQQATVSDKSDLEAANAKQIRAAAKYPGALNLLQNAGVAV